MSKIVKLEIQNFRSIENLSLNFPHDQKLLCLIGRGDSGKTTILEAISAVLSSTWNLSFHDTDFYNVNYNKPIKITANIVGIPVKLLSDHKFGLNIRAFNKQSSEISDDILSLEDTAHWEPMLSVRLLVDKNLEPNWHIINERAQDDKPISAAERALLNCYMVSDNIDRHFSWNKGNPLYSLLKSAAQQPEDAEENSIVLESLRSAKNKIDEHGFEKLVEVTDMVKVQAAGLGLNIEKTSTTLDFKELSIRDNRISLHDDRIPFRLKGKGSKRLASLAIQSILVKDGGIMLVDEIEQGLEPDRAKQLIRELSDNGKGQIFITTHSRDVITELSIESLILILKDKSNSKIEGRDLSHIESLQRVVRACPEAFFAKKIIVCEGATEVGIMRSLDKYRKQIGKQQMSFEDCAYIDGGGSSFVERAEKIRKANLKSVIFCDSDDPIVNQKKEGLKALGIDLFDCDVDKCIEAQVFQDIPWGAIKQLLQYALVVHKSNDQIALEASIKAQFPHGYRFNQNWLEEDTSELRTALAKASVKKDKEWFKRIDHGEFLGSIIFEYFDQINERALLKQNFEGLINWIDN
ncbi:ATP-dependent nuclease [Sphingobacterium bambusae]|uniref:ATP-dependent endonuclease n=1 Tax=Sphingobacterium bambusae TaxID=662858 RepID=A0ABW6BE74_9SPHI|nr:AAA family ATPase [Sphingobacterium bambusae]WPL48538.1 AAA family ATPase [Sphingobacterium bambusae]